MRRPFQPFVAFLFKSRTHEAHIRGERWTRRLAPSRESSAQRILAAFFLFYLFTQLLLERHARRSRVTVAARDLYGRALQFDTLKFGVLA